MSGGGLFVAGTDTGVGKSEIACGLLRAFARSGFAAVGMKPVAAGCRRTPGGLRNADVEALVGAGNVRAARALVNPIAFAPPIAPHIAAERAGTAIDLAPIVRAYRELARRADIVVVEGVGGLLVPFGPGLDASRLPAALGLPVVLVVGVRLGCLNHALLTVEALAARELVLAGWVSNRVARSMRAHRENVEALRERIAAPHLGDVGHVAGAKARARAIDAALDVSPLLGSVRNTHAARARRL